MNNQWHDLSTEEAETPSVHTDVLAILVNEDGLLTVDLVYWDGLGWFSSGIPDQYVFPLAWQPVPPIPDSIQARHRSAAGI